MSIKQFNWLWVDVPYWAHKISTNIINIFISNNGFIFDKTWMHERISAFRAGLAGDPIKFYRTNGIR